MGNMKDKFIGVAVAAMMAPSVAMAADYTMKISMGTGPIENNYIHTPLLAFEQEVEELSGGRIDVKFFWNFALGKHEAVTNMVRQGQVEALAGTEGFFAPYDSDLEVLGIPYLFLNRRVAYDVLDGDWGQRFADDVASKIGIRPIVWMENGGYRHFSSNKPMQTVDDLNGMKIRTMTNPIAMEMVTALGASPTPIAWADLYTSLQTGVVDGQENSLSTFRIPKLEEIQKHIILDGHTYSITSLWVNEEWLRNLPDDLRKIVDEAAIHMRDYNRELSAANDIADRTYLEQAGVTIVDLSDAEKARFRDLSQAPSIAVLREKIGHDIVDNLLSAVKGAEESQQ